MTSGRRFSGDSFVSRPASSKPDGWNGYFAELGQSEESLENTAPAATAWVDEDADGTLAGFLENLEDIFATSDDDLNPIG
jgi:hypothetical protein